MSDHKIEIKESIRISESYSLRTESHYLLISNREKCSKLLQKNDFDENDMIDFFISLHLVLEIGLNTFYRQISTMGIPKADDKCSVIKNIDMVGFLEKTILFIYFSKFKFNKIEDAHFHYSAISKIKNFNKLRNRLLHGHSVGTMNQDGRESDTDTRIDLNLENVKKQVEAFKEIMTSIQFYFDALDSSITQSGKADIKKDFLDITFLDQTTAR